MPSWEQKVLCLSAETPHKGQAMFPRTQRTQWSRAVLAAARELSTLTALACSADGAMLTGASVRPPGTEFDTRCAGGPSAVGAAGEQQKGAFQDPPPAPSPTRARLREAPRCSRPRGARARRSHGDPAPS